MDISSLWLVFLLNISRKALLGTCFCSSLTHTQPHSSHAMAASPAFYFLINHGKKNYRTSDCSAGSITQHQLHPLYNSPLGIHPEREPFLLGERICSSLCIIDSLISFPFLPEHLLYPRTMPHVRETVAKQTDQFLLSWSLQNHQPKNCRGGRGVAAVESAVVGSAKGPQSRFEELEERLGQVMRKGNCRPGPRKSMFKVQEVKN